MESVKLPIQPDATFVLHGRVGTPQEFKRRVFVEVDRGTRPTRTWADKISAYEAYRRSPELKARYDADDFSVLTIVPTEAQRRTLMQATMGMAGKVIETYRFALEADIHPDTIGKRWLVAKTMEKTGSRLRPVLTTEEFRYF